MKKCPRCAELVQDEAKVCRYCRAPLTVGSAISGMSCVSAIVFLAIGVWFLSWLGGPTEPSGVITPPVDQTYTAARLAECKRVVDMAWRNKLIRAEPRRERIDVEERLWSDLPASAKTGIAMGYACTLFGRPLQGVEGVAVYGYRSGRRLALATQVGVNFE